MIDYGNAKATPAEIIAPGTYDKKYREKQGYQLSNCPDHLCITSASFTVGPTADKGEYRPDPTPEEYEAYEAGRIERERIAQEKRYAASMLSKAKRDKENADRVAASKSYKEAAKKEGKAYICRTAIASMFPVPYPASLPGTSRPSGRRRKRLSVL